MEKSLEEVRTLWHSASESCLLKAYTEDINGYPIEIQQIIKDEVARRGLEGETYYNPSNKNEMNVFPVDRFKFDPYGDLPRFPYVSKASVPLIVFFEKWCGAVGVIIAALLRKIFYKMDNRNPKIITRKQDSGQE
jgi:hypothetical protein